MLVVKAGCSMKILKICNVFFGLALAFMGATSWGQVVYRCDAEGAVIYQDLPCMGDATVRTLFFPEKEKTGVDLQLQSTDQLAQDLAFDRRARQQQASIRRVQRALQKLHEGYLAERTALLVEREKLGEAPSYRNRQTNPIRQEKFEQRRRELGAAIDRLAIDFQANKAELKDRLRRAKLLGQGGGY